MTSVLQLTNPIFHLPISCYSPMSDTLPSPAIMSSMAKPSSSHEGYSSADSESKKKGATPGAKRRPSRAGTRSVTTLTAAQLERKRANDREAQRAIRQRTKDHIESLERRISELTSNTDNQRLLEVISRNEQLEQENAILRDRLTHTMGYVSENPAAAASATSPVERMSIINQPRPSSTSTARSIPSVAGQTATQPPPDAWQQHAAYSAPSTTSPMETHNPMSTAQDTRWSPHPHSTTTPVSAPLPSVPETSTAYQHHSVEPQQMNYYVPYSQEGAPPTQQSQQPQQQQQQHLPYVSQPQGSHHPSPQPAPLPQVHPQTSSHDYGQSRHLPIQQQSYTPFSQHGSYMDAATSQAPTGSGPLQHAGEGLQMLRQGQVPPGVQQNHLMYGMNPNVPSNLKVE